MSRIYNYPSAVAILVLRTNETSNRNHQHHIPGSDSCFCKGGKNLRYVILVLYFSVLVRLITWAKESFKCSVTFFS